MDKENAGVFDYSYSAKRNDELRAIREKYAPASEEKDNDKLERLRGLDRSVSRPGRIASITVGAIGIALFGWGMALVTVVSGRWFVVGLILGIFGIAGIVSAYPVFSRITKKRREALAPEILRLADELARETE